MKLTQELVGVMMETQRTRNGEARKLVKDLLTKDVTPSIRRVKVVRRIKIDELRPESQD